MTLQRLRERLVPSAGRALWVGSGWLLGDRIARILLGVVLNVVLARLYGPANFGQYAYAVTLATLFLPLSTLGLERIVVRELARAGGAEQSVLVSAGLLRFAGGLLGWGLAVLWSVVAGDLARGAQFLIVLVAAGNVWAACDVVDWSFQARNDFRTITVVRLGAFVAGTAAKLLLARAGAPLTAVAGVVLGEAALSGLLQLFTWWRHRAGVAPGGWRTELARSLFLAALPLLGAEAAIWVFQRADVVVLGWNAEAAAVGQYAVAQRLATAAFFLPGLVVQLLSPAVARAQDAATALALVQRTMNGLVLAAYLLATTLTLAAGPAVTLLFGRDYPGVVPLLRGLAWSNVFVFLGAAHGLYLVNRGEQRLLLPLSWVTAGVSLGLNFLLIPRWAATGAMWANVLAYATTTLFGVGLFAGSRPLLGANFRALAAPVTLLLALVRAPRRSSS